MLTSIIDVVFILFILTLGAIALKFLAYDQPLIKGLAMMIGTITILLMMIILIDDLCARHLGIDLLPFLTFT